MILVVVVDVLGQNLAVVDTVGWDLAFVAVVVGRNPCCCCWLGFGCCC